MGTPMPLYSPPEETTAGNPQYRRNGEPQSQFVCYVEEINLFPLPRLETRFLVASDLPAIPAPHGQLEEFGKPWARSFAGRRTH